MHVINPLFDELIILCHQYIKKNFCTWIFLVSLILGTYKQEKGSKIIWKKYLED